jgi:hypothetical protein
VAGLSLAANLAQFVALGLRSAQYLYKAYNGSEDFANEQAEVDVIVRNVRNSARTIGASLEPGTDRDLMELVDQTGHIARELEDVLEKLKLRASKGGRRARLELACHAFWYKSDIKNLQTRLIKMRDQVAYQLMVKSQWVVFSALLRFDLALTTSKDSREAFTLGKSEPEIQASSPSTARRQTSSTSSVPCSLSLKPNSMLDPEIRLPPPLKPLR